MLARMQGIVGEFPEWMLAEGDEAHKYFTPEGCIYLRMDDSGEMPLLAVTTVEPRNFPRSCFVGYGSSHTRCIYQGVEPAPGGCASSVGLLYRYPTVLQNLYKLFAHSRGTGIPLGYQRTPCCSTLCPSAVLFPIRD